jgi:hypothetical protein
VGQGVLDRIVPLAPTLALRIIPDPTLDRARSDFSFSHFGHRSRNLGRHEIVGLNRLIVRCAEETIFYRDDHSWIPPFVSRNRHYRVEPRTSILPTPTGTLLVSTLRVVAGVPPSKPAQSSSG